PAPARNAGHEVRTVGDLGEELAADAVVLEVRPQQLRRAGLVPRRIDRVESDQLPKEVDRLVPESFGHVRSQGAPAYLCPMGDLFSDAARERLPEVAPLASRVRPRTLDEFVGQRQIIGDRSALRTGMEQDRGGAMVL